MFWEVVKMIEFLIHVNVENQQTVDTDEVTRALFQNLRELNVESVDYIQSKDNLTGTKAWSNIEIGVLLVAVFTDNASSDYFFHAKLGYRQTKNRYRDVKRNQNRICTRSKIFRGRNPCTC